MLVIQVNPCKSQKADWENGIQVTSSALLCNCSFGSQSTPHGGGNSLCGFSPNTNKHEEEGAACLQTVSPHRRLNMQTEVSNEVILKDTYSLGLVPFFNDICTHVGDVFPLLFLRVVAILRGGGGSQRSVYKGNCHKFQNPAISKRFVWFALLGCLVRV